MPISNYLLKLAALALAGAYSLAASAETVSFNVASTYSLLGSVDTQTVPIPLLVALDAPALAPTFIQIISSDPSVLLVSGGGATILAGQLTSFVLLSGLQLGNANLTASFGGFEATALVSVVTQIPSVPEADTLALLSIGGLVTLWAARRNRAPDA